MPVPIRAAVLAVLAACAVALGACGGDDSYGDKVPRSTPELTPPAGADALVPDQASTRRTDTMSTDDTTTTTTPSAGGGAGPAAGGASAGGQAAPAQPQQPSAGTGGATTPTQPQQSTGGSGTGGTSPGEFNQFCRDNPGACPGN
jgi:hypothetical protein